MSEHVDLQNAARLRVSALGWTLAFVSALTAVRVIGLFVSPVELYPEEAQYWVWSRHLALGYFSKPPLIAWLIAATTALGGSGEAWVRLSAPLLHGLAALVLQRVGARLYDGRTGFWAAVLYSLAPGVQLSSAAIATDAPMLLFVSMALWAYAGLATTSGRREALVCAGGVGAALGLGALSKYAALYLVAGLVVHAIADPDARRRWRGPELPLAVGMFLLILTPNLVWNAAHGFETVAHTAADADWGDAPASAVAHAAGAHTVRHFDVSKAANFIVAQFGVFGPVPFAVLIIGGALTTGVAGLARRRPWPKVSADVLLLALTAPPLLIVLVQALITRANANWAAAAYSPGAVLVAAWLVRRRARWTLGASVVSQAVVGMVFFAAAMSPVVADQIGFANSFKRARGWARTAALVRTQAEAVSGRTPLSAIAVDDRFLFNALAYYDRAYFAARYAPPLRMWVREARPNNEAETSAPLTSSQGARVLFVDAVSRYRHEAQADFSEVRPVGSWSIPLDPKHARLIALFVGQNYSRRPRDPATGLPEPATDLSPQSPRTPGS